MLEIKELKHEQIFYAMSDSGEAHQFKAWMQPFELDGVWHTVAKDTANQSLTFTEEDETILFLTDSLEE